MSQVYIIDRFTNLYSQVQKILINLFGKDNILKVFHSYDNDLRWLVEDYEI
jgi:ribonuclease D